MDQDGDLDLIAHFSMRDIREVLPSLDVASVDAILTGQTFSGADILGTDLLRIVPPKRKK